MNSPIRVHLECWPSPCKAALLTVLLWTGFQNAEGCSGWVQPTLRGGLAASHWASQPGPCQQPADTELQKQAGALLLKSPFVSGRNIWNHGKKRKSEHLVYPDVTINYVLKTSHHICAVKHVIPCLCVMALLENTGKKLITEAWLGMVMLFLSLLVLPVSPFLCLP